MRCFTKVVLECDFAFRSELHSMMKTYGAKMLSDFHAAINSTFMVV